MFNAKKIITVMITFFLLAGLSFEAAAQAGLAGRYRYSYRHDTGTDSFVYDLRANGRAVYTTMREGGDDEPYKKGFWRWDAVRKIVYVTLTDSEGRKETQTFSVVKGNLVMKSNTTGRLFLNGKVFRKQ